ncbi:transglycosylase SLT domain-containing protein [Sulfurimonas sp.]|nr:transglycosylase SLT domain-containing protein [Sulfurimonas sp.]
MGFLLGKIDSELYKKSAEMLLKVVTRICYNILMINYLSLVMIFTTLFFSGCSNKEYFINSAKKHNLNHHTLRAIAEVESGNRSNVVNVNESIFNIQQGPHYFDNWFTANLYMDTILDPLFLSYDVGVCQINISHFDRNGLDNEDLLDDEINIELAAKILRYNLNKCGGDYNCALSMYNTGKRDSETGRYYTYKVLKARKKLFGY